MRGHERRGAKGERPGWAVAATAVALDELSQWWVRRFLPEGSTLPLPGGFALRRLENPGVTLGLGADFPWLWLLISWAALVLLVRYRRWFNGRTAGWGWGLVLGGAAGNAFDRTWQGTVTDFLQVPFWPGIMNLADIALRLGVLLLILDFHGISQPHAVTENGHGRAGGGTGGSEPPYS